MRYIDYVQLNPFQKFGYNFAKFFKKLPANLKKFFKALGLGIVHFFVGIGKGFAGYGKRFVKGDIFVKLSYLIMGLSNMVRGQIIKGLIFLLSEAAYISFMIFFAWQNISKLSVANPVSVAPPERYKPDKYKYVSTFIGNQGQESVEHISPSGRSKSYEYIDHDDSMIILLYSVLAIIVTIVFIAVYIASTKSAYKVAQSAKNGEKVPSFQQEIKQFFDEKFHVTLLTVPCILIASFTILPMIFMILIAFTNYGETVISPSSLFGWVGFHNFSELVDVFGGSQKANTFIYLTKWTITWAVFATFSNYIFGMIVALMINKKGIKFKALWRTLFVVVVAVPQFVSLLVMAQLLNSDNGGINTMLHEWFGVAHPIKFIDGDVLTARITVIVVNIWVGIPYTILITSGILMNIPADLYESATIDGAGPVKSFMKITLPYMLFVTTPYLITTFIGNINNFNVIYLLTGGNPPAPDSEHVMQSAGGTDLLVTWLFKLTTEKLDYKLASAVGILVFIVCATLSLITFNLTKSAKDEEAFS